MEIRELTIREKRYYPNASYVIITNAKKQYYTKKALIELQTKLNKLLISGVVGRSEQFYCFNKKNKRIDRCKNQCDTCKELKLMQ